MAGSALHIHSSPLDVYSQITPAELLTPKPVSARPATRKRSKPQRTTSESSSSADTKPVKKPRTRSAASSSTRLQQRKRAEIQALREQAQDLEAQVELLKKNKFLPADVALGLAAGQDDGALVVGDVIQKPPANWHEMAIVQYRERLVSEKTNRRLKSILENQEKVNGALSGLLQKRSVLNGMEFVLSTEPRTEQSLLTADSSIGLADGDNSKEILMELEELVQGLYKTWETKFHATTQSPAISCDMRIKQDAQRGKVVEFITTTPLSCSVQEASEILWKELTTYRDYPGKVYKYMKASKPNAHEKNFVMNARSPSGMLELNGLQYMQKFEEADRTVFVIAERMILASKNFQFRDECWMTVNPSSAETNASVVEIYLELYMEHEDESQVSPEDFSYAQSSIIGSLGNAFRKFFQAQQNALMEKAGRIVLPTSSKVSVID
ncbi:uncharacterized protein IUM83_17645 [Phytophthora cinnamomi]|uniref:uncharacterized protein n=1 Tax=Phytophthora cinnamomi TaxID=4785 RepID=UPI00355AB9DC|nr:hypothetical protein IUM83_17645 [Phytophthora cinnamomi]